MSEPTTPAAAAAADAGQVTQAAPSSTQSQPPDWFSGVPQDLAGEKSLAAFKGKPIGDFAKSYVEAQKMIGGSIRLPKPDATPEERSRFMQDVYTKLGRPESADKYSVTLKPVPDEIGFNQEQTKAFYAEAHKLGLSNDQLQGVMDWYSGYLNTLTPDYEALRNDGMKQLQSEFGNKTTEKIAAAQRILLTQGGKELADLVEQTGIGNSPAFIKLLAKFGEIAAEKGIVSGEHAAPMTRDGIQAEIDKIRGDKTHPYNDERSPKHTEAVQRMRDLYSMRASQS